MLVGPELGGRGAGTGTRALTPDPGILGTNPWAKLGSVDSTSYESAGRTGLWIPRLHLHHLPLAKPSQPCLLHLEDNRVQTLGTAFHLFPSLSLFNL